MGKLKETDMRFDKPSDTQVGGGHYKDMPIEPSEFCQKNKLNWCESNAIKYVCRHKHKNGREDIEKAIHYLQLLLEWEYPVEPGVNAETQFFIDLVELGVISPPAFFAAEVKYD